MANDVQNHFPSSNDSRDDSLTNRDFENPSKWMSETYRHGLVKKVYPWWSAGEEPKETSFKIDLAQVQRGIQDHDYMTQCRNLPIDPFLISGIRYIDRHVLNSAFKDMDQAEKGHMKKNAELRWDNHAASIVGSHTRTSSTRLFKHLAVAVVGAGFLIGPMWLMMLNDGLYTALISTTVFIGAFGAMNAVVLDKHMDILSSTAAYAAVLMVFVGLTRGS
ncbi:hypothetical protein F5Y02DRAFT_423658 [Annulohypoxylon stygium]|nr:hypothetical protein F5Y02DRAFT_423658 [Annulohypoxylon stygium]